MRWCNLLYGSFLVLGASLQAEAVRKVPLPEYREPKIEIDLPLFPSEQQESAVVENTPLVVSEPYLAQNEPVQAHPNFNLSPDADPPAPALLYNPPVRPVVQEGINVWLRGDALVWQAVEENLTYAYRGTDGGNQISRDFKTVHFNWDWGFRLGAGYNTPRDGWDLVIDWTHIHNTAQGKVKSGNESLFQVYVNAANVNGTGTQFDAHWHVHLDQIDLSLGREFLVGDHLAIRPNARVRTAWIDQSYRIDYDFATGGNQDADLKNRFWGFGFVGGIDSDWRLGAGFSLFGNADLSILLGFFSVHEKGKAAQSTLWEVSNSFRSGRAVLDLALGIKWFHTFWKERIGLTFKAGYEYHQYFDQNQLLQSNGNVNFETFNPVKGDLTYQGVALSAQIDF